MLSLKNDHLGKIVPVFLIACKDQLTYHFRHIKLFQPIVQQVSWIILSFHSFSPFYLNNLIICNLILIIRILTIMETIWFLGINTCIIIPSSADSKTSNNSPVIIKSNIYLLHFHVITTLSCKMSLKISMHHERYPQLTNSQLISYCPIARVNDPGMMEILYS